jgi:hypothetical protein
MHKRMGAQDRGEGGTLGIGRRARFALPLLAGVLVLLAAAPAQASFHLMKVREVYPAGDSSYVELQMFSAGEYLVAGHHLVAYNADGSVANDFTLPSNVSAASPSNSTILIADSGYASAFPGGPAPDEVDTGLNLSAGAGAVCWTDGSPPDCVSWGAFTGPFPAHVPALTAGGPASPSGVTAGKALRRSIAAGCPTFLEAEDDTDSSLADFSEQTPNPRSNTSAIVEHACTPPAAAIDSKPKTPTKSTSASFTYHSTPSGAEFECKLDAGAFASCPLSGTEYSGLADGGHTFQVRAKNAEGMGTAAFATWTVDTKAPTASIKSHPIDPSSGASASFSYSSDEANSNFECSLALGAAPESFAPCPAAGETYSSLANGIYTFEVRATDQAENTQAGSTQFSWEVDNSLSEPPLETTPPPSPPPGPIPLPAPAAAALDSAPAIPNTLITGKPGARTHDRTPTFHFHSSEAGATLQCKLDSGAFKSCHSPFTTKRLLLGPHTLKVRAVLGETRDSSPATASFTIVGAR